MEPKLVKPKINPHQAGQTKATEYGEDEPTDLELEAFKVIRRHEGFKEKPYTDTKGKRTIGIGTLIGDGSEEAYRKSPYFNKTITEDQAAEIARGDIKAKIATSERLLGRDYLYSVSPALQAQIISSVYRGGLSGSPNTMKLLKAGKFEDAAREYINNDEYRKSKAKKEGVYKRMDETAAIMAAEGKRGFASAVEDRLKQQPKN
jgi:GH24 family phage-related lysozyme (muramidase)